MKLIRFDSDYSARLALSTLKLEDCTVQPPPRLGPQAGVNDYLAAMARGYRIINSAGDDVTAVALNDYNACLEADRQRLGETLILMTEAIRQSRGEFA